MEMYTIGYEGTAIEEFTQRLLELNINVVADVRRTPISRKPKFSKKALAEELANQNIQYIHFRELGTPREIRDKLAGTKDYVKFRLRYRRYLKSKVTVLGELSSLMKTKKVVLMCVEHDPDKCHRSVIAAVMKEIDGNRLRIHSL
jgi:uncharacterized protein (DUF488 family)